jgi:hypothetical protein
VDSHLPSVFTIDYVPVWKQATEGRLTPQGRLSAISRSNDG